MAQRPFLLLLLFILTGWLATHAQSPKPAVMTKDQCSVSGTVVTLAGSEPLKSSIVVLQSTDDRTRTPSTFNTDSGGRFQLKGIPAGHYRLRVMRNGFVSQEYGQRTLNAPGALLTLASGQEMKDLVFRMIPAAIISGRIENEDGEPLPWAHVSALREIYSEGKRTLSSEETVPTNDRGEYRLFGLRPGRYFIAATYRLGATRVGDAEYEEFGQLDNGRENYVRTYYPGSPDPAKAETIYVKAGEEVPSMNFMFRPTAVYRVKGRVYNLLATDTKRSHSIMVYLEPKNSSLLNTSMTFGMANVTKPDGTFDLPGVLPGTYTLHARWSDESKNHSASLNVEVGAADVEGVQLTIAKGMSLSGHIHWDGDPSLQGEDLWVRARGNDNSDGLSHARVESDGSFTWSDVPDEPIRVSVFGQSPDSYLKAVSYGGVESLQDGFTPRAGSAATLEVTLSSRGARVQGAAIDADGLPSVGVWVILVPAEKHRDLRDPYQAVTTDQHGQFLLRGIAPGDYKLFSWDEVDEGAWQDPDFLKPFESKGEKVSVQEGDTKSVDLVTIKTASTEQQKP